MLAANWSNGVHVLLLPLLAYIFPLKVTLDTGGSMRTLFVVSVGKMMRNSALIAFSRGVMVGEKRDTW